MQFLLTSIIGNLETGSSPFIEVFKKGDLSIELYQPKKVDNQQPHNRDEVYIIRSGNGKFSLAGRVYSFSSGDLFFVPLGKEHRFADFSDDFSTWVVFFGPAVKPSANTVEANHFF